MVSTLQRTVLQLIADKRLDSIEEGDEHFEIFLELYEAGLVTGIDASADDAGSFLRTRITLLGRMYLERSSVE